tara:strand:- start:60 stop:278 length:219 start_codon:yes stop_codon:yes gene_type:complete
MQSVSDYQNQLQVKFEYQNKPKDIENERITSIYNIRIYILFILIMFLLLLVLSELDNKYDLINEERIKLLKK